MFSVYRKRKYAPLLMFSPQRDKYSLQLLHMGFKDYGDTYDRDMTISDVIWSEYVKLIKRFELAKLGATPKLLQ